MAGRPGSSRGRGGRLRLPPSVQQAKQRDTGMDDLEWHARYAAREHILKTKGNDALIKSDEEYLRSRKGTR